MAERRLTVYSRADCHLCVELIGALRELRGIDRFRIEVVDVDAEPELRRRYGDKVPVLVHCGIELCRYRLDRETVAAYLAKVS